VISFVCLTVKPVGEPDAGNPHVRFGDAEPELIVLADRNDLDD
jgi:hypothetical protein